MSKNLSNFQGRYFREGKYRSEEVDAGLAEEGEVDGGRGAGAEGVAADHQHLAHNVLADEGSFVRPLAQPEGVEPALDLGFAKSLAPQILLPSLEALTEQRVAAAPDVRGGARAGRDILEDYRIGGECEQQLAEIRVADTLAPHHVEHPLDVERGVILPHPVEARAADGALGHQAVVALGQLALNADALRRTIGEEPGDVRALAVVEAHPFHREGEAAHHIADGQRTAVPDIAAPAEAVAILAGGIVTILPYQVPVKFLFVHFLSFS